MVESGGLLPLTAEARAPYSELFGEAADGSVHTKHPGNLRSRWRPNVSMNDLPGQPDSNELRREEPMWWLKPGEQPPKQLDFDPFDVADNLLSGWDEIDGSSLFASVISFLRPCAIGLCAMLTSKKLDVCLALGDGHAVCEAQQLAGAGRYDRIFLSNVPDYTTMANAFLYFAPALKTMAHCCIEHTILLATTKWTDLDEYIHSGSLLTPEMVAPLVGVQLSSGDLMDVDGMPRWGVAQTTVRADKAKVEGWLQRLLLAAVWPTPRPAEDRMRENCALNISVVFRAV